MFQSPERTCGSGRSPRWIRAASSMSRSSARCSPLVRWSRQNRTRGSLSRRSFSTVSLQVGQMPYVPSSILCRAEFTSLSASRKGAAGVAGATEDIAEVNSSRLFSSCSRMYGSLTPGIVTTSTSEILASFAAVLSDSCMGIPLFSCCLIGFAMPRWRFRDDRLRQQAPRLSLEPCQTTLESRPHLMIDAGSDGARTLGFLKVGESVPRYQRRTIRLALVAFVVNRQLFVRFQSLARISEHLFPQIARECQVAFAFC